MAGNRSCVPHLQSSQAQFAITLIGRHDYEAFWSVAASRRERPPIIWVQ